MCLYSIVMKKIGFCNDRYLQMQSEHIKERIALFGDKLYLEFGGKLFDDHHASRVLPGFAPDSKLKMLMELQDDVEILIVISANDIEKNKVRNDLGITYDVEVLRLIDAYREIGLYVGSVTITHFANQPAAISFKQHLENLGVKVFLHYPIIGYPNNIPFIVSEDGYGKNDYIETSKPLVVVTAPGPGSGKMATCLSQLYNEHTHGIKAGYAKFETFPIWNLPLKHPVNLAYEAATADLNDVNMIDPFHLEAYGETTVNYNRDIEIFPVLNTMFETILGESPYKSPTDMGVNMAGNCIIDDLAVREASHDEIIRRYYQAKIDFKKGKAEETATSKIEVIMSQAKINGLDRKCVPPTITLSQSTNAPAFTIELMDGTLVTGKTSKLLGCGSAALLNALKVLANIDDDILVIAPEVLKPIQDLKIDIMGNRNPRLHTDEVLLALAVSATMSEDAKKAYDKLSELIGCEAHCSVILSEVDFNVLRKLKVNISCEPKFQTRKLYQK